MFVNIGLSITVDDEQIIKWEACYTITSHRFKVVTSRNAERYKSASIPENLINSIRASLHNYRYAKLGATVKFPRMG